MGGVDDRGYERRGERKGDRGRSKRAVDSGRPVCYLLEPAAYDAMGVAASLVLPSVSAAMSYSGPAVLVFRRVQMLRIQGRTSRRAIQARPPRPGEPGRPCSSCTARPPPAAFCCPSLCPEGPAPVDGRSVCLTTHEGGPMTRGPCGAVRRSEKSSPKILPEPGEAQHTLIVPGAARALLLPPPGRAWPPPFFFTYRTIDFSCAGRARTSCSSSSRLPALAGHDGFVATTLPRPGQARRDPDPTFFPFVYSPVPPLQPAFPPSTDRNSQACLARPGVPSLWPAGLATPRPRFPRWPMGRAPWS